MKRPLFAAPLAAAALLTAGLTPAVAAPAAHRAPAAVSYASPTGSGSLCTRARPCSLEGARASVRARIARSPGRDLRVELLGGTYPMTSPLRLGAADSGRDGATVSWEAAPGARPVLSGGETLRGWHENGDGTWSAPVPAGTDARQLFVNGVRATRARGAACSAAVCDADKDGMSGAKATGIDGWADATGPEAVIKVRWRMYRCRVTSVHGDRMTFAEPCWKNASSGTGRTGPSWDSTAVDSSGYTGVAWFENARELIDQPGEFAYDSGRRTVTYLPRPGEDMRHSETVAPASEHLVELDGAHDLSLSGLGFAYAAYDQPDTADGYVGTQAGLTLTGESGPADMSGSHYTEPAAAVTVRGGRWVALERDTFSRLGGAGVIFQQGTRDSSVRHSRFTGISSGALYIGDTDPHPTAALTGSGNTVAYNTIDHTGLDYTDSVGIWAGYEQHLTLDHNTLRDLPYAGISVGWGWNQPNARTAELHGNRVTGNRISDVMRVADGQHDGGAIYTQGDQPGTVIADNYIDRAAYGNTQLDGNGVYLDEQSSHITVEHNVVTRVGFKWVSNWADYGIDNTVRANWTDTSAPALGGTGSTLSGNRTGLDTLPAAALAVAARAGAGAPAVDPLLPDLARAGHATQSTTDGTATADAALDGDTTTDSGTTARPGSWWQVDLGRVRSIGSVELWNDASMTTKDAVVSVSTTPDFAHATTVTLTGSVLRPSVLGGLRARGRYVRVTAPGGAGVGLADVRVHP
ncbi:right-handed parallel beta-helix repeat-containing protein [Streptomyces sp. DW26H14]|uniref:right-handed parallel beta-helix repeat-containing protein n=1 Tax=Streptomyces sp. DW26H14 TaxID=3435395 RepID=UPI00403D9288